MNRLGKSEVAHGEILTVDEVIERIDAVTAEDARDAAVAVLSGEPSLAVIGPLGKDALRGVMS